MLRVDAELDRYLVLLGNKIRERGFTQLEVQEALGWGRSYISQLVTKQKGLRVEQILLILNVIGVDPEEFYAELYRQPGPRYVFAAPSNAAERGPGDRGPGDPRPGEEQQRELQQMKTLLDGVVELLLKKKLIKSEDLRAAAVAAGQEAIGEG